MRKPVLYIDVVGTLLVDKGGELAVAPFARPFVEGIRDRFRTRLLTELEEHQAQRVARTLGLEASYVPFRKGLGKTSAINLAEDFFWIDDDPTPADLIRLSDERRSERLIPSSRREGANQKTLEKLLIVYEETRKELPVRRPAAIVESGNAQHASTDQQDA